MYDLQHLGWYGFQELCNSIAREILGQTAMSYLPSNDGGRDGSYYGKWNKSENDSVQGNFVIQCKFTSKQNYNLKLSDLSEELPKAELLVKKGICDIYIIMTNAGISGRVAEKIQTEFKAVGSKHVYVFGGDWISSQIKENPRLRRMVPRVYGLGDLSQILDARVYSQGAALLEYLKEDLAKVVITTAYNRAAKSIEEHNFVLLVGEPAAGKTTIASLLAMGALDQWKAMTLKLDTAEQVIKHWNPEEPGQFFWIDDAFGVTQYESTLSGRWNHAMPLIKTMLNKGAKIVMTSRDYIYNAARKDLKVGAFPLLNESQVVIDVHNLTLNEKRQMLYNHIKMGRQPIKFRSEIKNYLEQIATHERFIPEIARRIADPFFTKNLEIKKYSLDEFVHKQESFLLDILNDLDKDSQAALALIYMNSERLKLPLDLNEIEHNAISRLGSSLSGCIDALEAMKGNMVQSVIIEDEMFWKYKHPTIGDAYAKFIVSSSDMLIIYLYGSSVDMLLGQITCGNVNLENAVIVPKNLFTTVLKKLKAYRTTKQYKTDFLSEWGAKRNLYTFLSRRCSVKFLKIYIEENPDILELISHPSVNLDYSPEVELVYTLFSSGLLPENFRKKFIDIVSIYAIEGHTLHALRSDDIKEMFNVDEFEELLERIKAELIPKISNLKETYKSNYRQDEDAEYHMSSLKEDLEIIELEFSDEPQIVFAVNREITEIEEWVIENTSVEKIIKREKLSTKSDENQDKERSIFDDIDK